MDEQKNTYPDLLAYNKDSIQEIIRSWQAVPSTG